MLTNTNNAIRKARICATQLRLGYVSSLEPATL
jgi:hypothetical protein